MSAPLTEFVIETVLRDGLGDLHANPNKLDDIFSKFKEAQFLNQYGQSKIDQLKTYIANNQIKLVQSWSLVPLTVPCISIQLESSSEDPDIQDFGYGAEDEDYAVTPKVLFPVITPGTYDIVSGKLTIINSVDLSTLSPGRNFVDSDGVIFTILSGISNVSGNKFINIGPGMTPNVSADGRIESPLDFARTERRMIRLREGISLGCHAKDDIHLAKFIFYLLVYILKSRQDSLITRGIQLDWGQGSMYNREDAYAGENIFSRFLKTSCLTEFDWDQGDVNLIDSFDLTLKAPAPKPDSTGTVILTETSGG